MAKDDIQSSVRPYFPFSAIVGNESAKKALKVALSSEDINSILICGHKGTGKTLLSRSVESISSGKKLITLPLNSSEEQIFGGIDIEKTLQAGIRKLSDSVLIRSDGNILLLENINLADEHIVYQIMNAAIQHFNTVEREGISQTHDCDFLLIATMDPEEGEISNHMLDRFDICVFTDTIDDEDLRACIVKRGIDYEADPHVLMKKYRKEDMEVSDAISKARKKSKYTRVPDGYCGAISELCNELKISGHRGDIAVMNAACSIAALDGRDTVNLDDLKEAAAMCLEHRRNDILPDEPPDPSEPPENNSNDQNDDSENDDGLPEDPHDAPNIPDIPLPPKDDAKEETFSVGDVFDVIDYLSSNEKVPTKNKSGRRSKSKSDKLSGRCVGYIIPKSKITDIALSASIRAASPYQIARDHSNLAVVLTKDDLREKVRERKEGNKILFMVDGSGSIGAQKRMIAVKGAIMSLLKDAYQKRDEVGMSVFRKDSAEEILPMTKSVLRAYKMLEDVPTGGKTPLIHALLKGYEILKTSNTDSIHPVMIILTDGRVNVPYTPGKNPFDELIETAESMSESGIRFIVVDTEAGRLRFGFALELCRALKGTYLQLEELNADYLGRSVKMAIESKN
jgi:magnesium chelatase subunit D